MRRISPICWFFSALLVWSMQIESIQMLYYGATRAGHARTSMAIKLRRNGQVPLFNFIAFFQYKNPKDSGSSAVISTSLPPYSRSARFYSAKMGSSNPNTQRGGTARVSYPQSSVFHTRANTHQGNRAFFFLVLRCALRTVGLSLSRDRSKELHPPCKPFFHDP